MPFVSRTHVLERLKSDGRNSSHFVWLLTELRYYECANGWLFAFRQVADVTLVALEPLMPARDAEAGTAAMAAAFGSAWEEFARAAEVGLAAFVAVYEPFAALLRKGGFTCVKVGQEPWV